MNEKNIEVDYEAIVKAIKDGITDDVVKEVEKKLREYNDKENLQTKAHSLNKKREYALGGFPDGDCYLMP